MWWYWYGGFAPPNRFMLTLVPLGAVAAMVGTQALGRDRQIAAMVLWSLSLAMGVDCLITTDSWYSLSHPAASVTRLTGLQCLAVTYRFPDERSEAIAGMAVAGAGLVFFAFFAWGAWPCATPRGITARRVRQSMGIAAVFVLLTCAVVLGLSHRPLQIKDTDIPTAAGILKAPQLERTDTRRLALHCDLAPLGAWQLSEASAFAVHHLDDGGRIISQEDFNLVLYVDDWMRAQPTNRARFVRDLTIPIDRLLHPPPGTMAVRVGLYDGLSGKIYGNQWRHRSEVLPLAFK
jgi:hypothetical protein